jgi:adenosine deaminase/adenosine deaminase CECR1
VLLLICLLFIQGLTSQVVVAPVTAAAECQPQVEAAICVSDWFDSHRDRPTMLRAFVQRMPKGGDIHTHLSGAVYAESYIEWAAENGYCFDIPTTTLVAPPCGRKNDQIPATELMNRPDSYIKLIDVLSTRNLAYAGQSGHDQFFATFGGFGTISKLRGDDMLARVAARAAAQHVFYLEIMMSFQGSKVRNLGKQVLAKQTGWEQNLELARQRLLDNGMLDLIDQGRVDIKILNRQYRNVLDCKAAEAKPGCDVTIRFLQQTTRTKPLAEVFAQLVYAFELVKADPWVVGINLVAPEDNEVALRDYTSHMKMIKFLHERLPDVNIALHAGELTLGLVPPRHLRFHIRQAVEIGQAQRIGHGVDIFYEDDPLQLMEVLQKRGVLVEICLTSNDVILEVRGKDHPLPDYLSKGVPVTLASDDEGVSRIDLSNEYLRATLTYDLGYSELKRMARNSLEYSFLSGTSLWRTTKPFAVVDACAQDAPGAESPSGSCSEFLNESDRAREQWRLEEAFREFENLPWFR